MTSGGQHYVPILKGKQGELDALKHLRSHYASFTPLIEVPPIPSKWIAGEETPVSGKTIDEHIAYMETHIEKAVGNGARILVDGQFVEEEPTLATDQEPIGGLLGGLRSRGIHVVPVLGLDRVQEYTEAVKAHIQTAASGCCLRLNEDDLETVFDLEAQINSLLDFLAVSHDQVDLLLDFGAEVPPRATLPFLVQGIARVSEWRSLILSSSAFPRDMVGIPQHSVVELERKDWLAWLSLWNRRGNIPRLPTFSDYTINHPILTEMDPRLMAMSPNIRYTASTSFVIAKGEAFPKGKRRKRVDLTATSAATQYRKLSAAIMKHGEWCGPSFSWGDKFIEGCANGKHTGNATQWRAVGVSHHIAYVVKQLSMLP